MTFNDVMIRTPGSKILTLIFLLVHTYISSIQHEI